MTEEKRYERVFHMFDNGLDGRRYQAPLSGVVRTWRVTSAGKQFVELLAKEDFAGAVARFDATLKTASPEPKLRETWQALQAQVGAFRNSLKPGRPRWPV